MVEETSRRRKKGSNRERRRLTGAEGGQKKIEAQGKRNGAGEGMERRKGRDKRIEENEIKK